jgi:hypothetical protein
MAYKGFFKPQNPKKYKGDSTNIIYRSRWELRLMDYLDKHPDVVQWASEEFSITYLHPVDKKPHRYFPDFWVKKKKKDGTTEVLVIEIKPEKQTKEPKKPAKVNKKYINECITYSINKAKWKYAEEFCKDRNWKFVIFTEKDLGIKF